MSVIGDYVHWTKRGYVNAKFSNKDPELNQVHYQDAQKAINEKHKKIQTQYMVNQRQKMAAAIEQELLYVQDLLFPETREEPLSNEEQQYIDNLKEDWLNILQDKFQGLTINPRTLTRGSNIFGRTQTRSIHADAITPAEIQKIVDKVNRMTNRLGDYLQKHTRADIQNTQNELKQMKTDLISVKKDLVQLLTQNTESMGKRQLAAHKKQIAALQQQGMNLNEALNKIIRLYKYSNSTAVVGAIGETFVTAALAPQAMVTGMRAIHKMMITDSKWSANERHQSGYDTTYFPDWLDDSEWRKILDKDQLTVTQNNFVGIVDHDFVQDKADVTIYTQNEEGPIGISVKNYSEYWAAEHGIGILKGSPFLYMVQNENEFDFVNHYLNLFTVAKNYETTGSYSKMAQEGSYLAHIVPMRDEMYTAMKKLLVYKAFTGNQLIYKKNGDQAGLTPTDIFIYIERPSKKQRPKIKVFTMTDIINKTWDSMQINLPTAIPQEQENTYQERINTLLQYLHAFKVSGSINFSTFNPILD